MSLLWTLCNSARSRAAFGTFAFARRRKIPTPNVLLPSSTVVQRALYFSTTATRQPVQERQKDEIYQELKWLSQEIRRHDVLYYNNERIDNDSDAISDDDYDALVRREEEICKQYPDLLQKWETESGLGKEATRVGGRVGTSVIDPKDTSTSTPRFIKRKHLTPMLSLDNVTTKEQLYAWLERLRKKILLEKKDKPSSPPDPIQILTEPKLDGLSLSLRYKLDITTNQYELVWASTRGDGKTGQDVTKPVVEGMKLPTKLVIVISPDEAGQDVPDILEVRGEVVLPKTSFEKLKEQTLEISQKNESAPILTFSNARNAASGILLRKEQEDVTNTTTNDALPNTLSLQSMLQFYAYDVTFSGPGDGQAGPAWNKDALAGREQLQDWGFQVAFPTAVTTLNWIQDGSVSNATEEEIVYQPWTDQDLEPMLQYYDALGSHRQHLYDLESNKQSKTSDSKTDTGLQWGDYDMDGCVHKVTQLATRQLVGNSNRAPRWAIAHKYPSQSAITALQGIEIQVGRKTGALTPVAILEPVELAGGVTVTRATLHNFHHMKELFGGNEKSGPMFLAKGSKVLVRRAGDVIPQVIQLAEPPKLASSEMEANNVDWIDLSFPSSCPACGSPAVVDVSGGGGQVEAVVDGTMESEANATNGQVLRCGGPQLLCPPRAVGALVHAYSRDALYISGLSEKRIQQLVSLNETLESSNEANNTQNANTSRIKLRYPSDVFKIAKDPLAVEALADLPGWGSKSANNLATTANQVATNGVSLSRFIYSLGIRYAGVHSSKILATAYGNVDAFLESLEEASKLQHQSREGEIEHAACNVGLEAFAILTDKENNVNKGIGPSLISSLLAFAREDELRQAAKNLASLVKVLDDEDYVEGGKPKGIAVGEENREGKPFFGMKVVFTGSLGKLAMTRKEAQALAKTMGAAATPGSISSATDLVVVGEKGGGKKLDAARDRGIKIMDVEEFAILVEAFQGASKN